VVVVEAAVGRICGGDDESFLLSSPSFCFLLLVLFLSNFVCLIFCLVLFDLRMVVYGGW
jgi:hypothetical protein